MYTNSYPAREISQAEVEQNIENLKRKHDAFLESLKSKPYIPGRDEADMQAARAKAYDWNVLIGFSRSLYRPR